MQRFEHLCATWATNKDDWMHQNEKIHELQRDGWELASMVIYQTSVMKQSQTVLWFKRPYQARQHGGTGGGGMKG